MQDLVNIIACSLLNLRDTAGNGHDPRKPNTGEKELEARKHEHYHSVAVFI